MVVLSEVMVVDMAKTMGGGAMNSLWSALTSASPASEHA
jgi:hypothetical protein